MGIFAGWKKIALVVLVLGVIGIGYTAIQWLQDTGKQELKIEQLEDQLILRRRIDEAIRTAPRDVDAADSLLREFLDSNL